MIGISSIKNLLGNSNERLLKSVKPLVDEINSKNQNISTLTDDKIKEKTNFFKSRIENGETLENILPEAFAVVREVADRKLGLRPFDVQLIGGIFLHKGYIAEMKTGEGKTLTATLPL